MQDKRVMYLNPKQRELVAARQKDRTAIWGRGTGKSHTMGVTQRVKAALMPRSKGFISSTTYNQLQTKTWPAIEKSFNLMGMKEGRDYVFGIRPPKHFDTTVAPPRNFSNVVSLKNGRCIEFLSMDRPDLARGGSYDDGEIDECLLVKQEHINVVLMPSLRGNLHRFNHTHWHHSLIKYSSMPWKSSGLYLLDFKEKAKQYPDQYFYSEATAYDNIHILGNEGIERMRRELTSIQFSMEVMNQLIIRTEEAFYTSYDDSRHLYEPGFLYGIDGRGRDVTTGTTDVVKGQMLELSWDFGGWFTCCGVFQEHHHPTHVEERMINAFSVGSDGSIVDVVRQFCEHYRDHQYKLVRCWGEPHGHDRQANMTDSNYEFMRKEFAKHGWTVEVAAPRGTSRAQKERRTYMATIMAEDTRGYPHFRLSSHTCHWVDMALKAAPAKSDGSKDKSSEKDRAADQRHATHITDAIDYYFDQKWGPRLSLMSGGTLGTAGSVEFL